MAFSERHRALAWYGAAVYAVTTGVAVAMARYPGGFDWMYTVISRLASRNHNPDGGAWLSGGLLVGMLLLWPAASGLREPGGPPGLRTAVAALRVGLIGGVLLAIEGLFAIDLSRIARKGHEILALVTLLALYGGILGLYVHRIRRDRRAPLTALLVVGPLIAIGLSQMALYFDQRDLGWVNTGWRELGVPLWYSFAFWQWLAVAVLGIGLGHLIATSADVRREGARLENARSGIVPGGGARPRTAPAPGAAAAGSG
jgi:hypothetical protein